MNRKMTLASAALMICIFWPGRLQAQESSVLLYAQGNFFIYDGVISSMNYRVGTMLPLGTAVTVVKKDAASAVCKIIETEKAFTFVNAKATGKSMDEIFPSFFAAENPSKKLIALTPDESKVVKASQVMPGMSRAAVLLSLGPPPPQETPTPESGTWTYWKNKFASSQFKIVFDAKGNIESVTGASAPVPAGVATAAASEPASDTKPEGSGKEIWYATCNIHYEKSVVSWANYLRGPIIPFNTKVQVLTQGKDRVVFQVTETGVKITFKNNQGKSGTDTWKLFTRLFDTKDQAPKLGKLSKADKQKVMGAEVVAGMSKEAVQMSWGPPPPHATASFQSDTWVYWKGKTDKVNVIFDDNGKVTSIVD